MFYDTLQIIFNKRFLFSIILHILHGFIFEKSKLYYPYTFSRNILLIKTDLIKFYLSSCFVFVGIPYMLCKLSPNKYIIARSYTENRYQNRRGIDVQIGSYLLGISMMLTGFCPSYLPIYLAISPVLFLYSTAASYTAYIFYHVFAKLIFNRINIGPINTDSKDSRKRFLIENLNSFFFASSVLFFLAPIFNEKETLNNIGRIIILSICIILLLIFETSEQSISSGHTSDELLHLIYHGDYLPPGLTGIFCGLINFFLIFICNEYQTLTSEWLINIFYYTSELRTYKTKITGQLCVEQIFKILAMAFGVRLSLLMSERQEIPNINWLFYSLVGSGSFIGAFALCLTRATFTDHIHLMNAFMGRIPSEIVSMSIGIAWFLLYFTKLFGISNIK